MTRPGDAEWSVLQLDSDPVPGDPESFEEITRAYQELARTTQEAHDLLASGSQIDVGQGKAMDAFRDLIGKLPGRLDGMANSYASAADAYLRYLPSLEEAQTMSLRALDQARQAAGDQSAAQAAAVSAAAALLVMNADTTTTPDAKEQATDDATAAKNRAADAQQALDGAKSLLGQATALRDQAARTAADTLRQLAKDAPQRSLWDKIVEAFNAFIDFLQSTVIEWITTILDVLSVVASFIFPPLGSAIGFLSGAIDLAAAALGGDPAEIALAAGGLALGLVPGGRIVSRVLKFANKFAGKIRPGSVADGIRNSTKEVTGGSRSVPGAGAAPGRGIDANVTEVGLGKVIKGVFNKIDMKLFDLRFNRDLKAAKKKQANDPTLIIGQNSKGHLKTFHASDVESTPLVDNNGKLVGVLFPSRATDNDNFTSWARTDANLAFGRNIGGTAADPGTKAVRKLPGTDTGFAGNEFLPPPWAGLRNDPTLVIAHGNPNGAAVRLANGKLLHVPGGEFAKVLHHNELFDPNSKRSIALISCNFANASGSAGQDFADAMAALGNRRKIFAANEVVVTTEGVDVDGLVTSPGRPIATLAVQNGGEFAELKPKGKGAK
ncbi:MULTISPECIES: putative T7SS-secreted protein [unclassified Micromonospora]|uniref:putative T7SS-secreted protein n=1 Tax=unclassified Micromonospora TaxID=2617518 RepID=UPI0033DB5B33